MWEAMDKWERVGSPWNCKSSTQCVYYTDFESMKMLGKKILEYCAAWHRWPTKLVLYAESHVEPWQADLVRFLSQNDLSGNHVEEAKTKRLLKSLFQDQGGVTSGPNYSSAVDFWVPLCVHMTSLTTRASSVLLGPAHPTLSCSWASCKTWNKTRTLGRLNRNVP